VFKNKLSLICSNFVCTLNQIQPPFFTIVIHLIVYHFIFQFLISFISLGVKVNIIIVNALFLCIPHSINDKAQLQRRDAKQLSTINLSVNCILRCAISSHLGDLTTVTFTSPVYFLYRHAYIGRKFLSVFMRPNFDSQEGVVQDNDKSLLVIYRKYRFSKSASFSHNLRKI
jgi:hypothetical protein